ncbi:MAG: glycosyltransferase [Ignavibacteriales bacterium]|nr:MAG: glycosyltransferase [Ignavibacteriales bacterium]
MKKIKLFFIARNWLPNIGGLEKSNYDTYCFLKKSKKVKITLLINTGYRYSVLFLIKVIIKSFFIKEKIIYLCDALLSICNPILKFRRKIVVIRIHGLDLTGPNKLYQLIIPKLVNLSDKIVCNSQASKNECIKRNINLNKIEVITPGIEFNEFKNNKKNYSLLQKPSSFFKNKIILLTIGRLVKRKGVLYFLKNIFPHLDKKLLYIVAGEGPDYNEILDTIKNLKLEKRVFVLGKVSESIKSELLNMTDVLLMPNIPIKNDVEGFGIVGLEANSYGKPILAHNVDGLQDLVQRNKNGMLINIEVKNGLIKNYKEKLNEVLKLDSSSIYKYSKSRFDWEKLTINYINIFNQFQ